MLENRCYSISISEENEISTINGIINLTSEVQYSDYIQAKKYSTGTRGANASVEILQNEVIIYGKNGQKIFFHYIKEKNSYNLIINDVDDDKQISCKLAKQSINICALSQNGQIKLKFIAHIFFSRSEKDIGLDEKYSMDISQLNNHENAIIYDTENSQYKIICANKKGESNIECLAIYFDISSGLVSGKMEYSFNVNIIEINDYQGSFKNGLDNCNFTRFNSEYLICCGKTNSIKCTRRYWNFSLINDFTINLPGKISNLTLKSNEDNMQLLYYSQTESENSLYEYSIYPPTCIETSLELTTYGTGELNINDLFQRVTDTNYYISFKDIPTNHGFVKVNDESFVGRTSVDPILLEDKENIFYFVSVNNEWAKFQNMFYNISIEESYPIQCKLKLIIKLCYKSCKGCTIKGELSDENNHNCVQCADGYYPFQESGTNCYTMEEGNTHTNWYFNDASKFFGLCHSTCGTCSGPLETNCLSCDVTEESNNKFLYEGKCLSQCPEGTFSTTDSDGKKICSKCYKNCKTCEQSGDYQDMKCISCQENNIIYENNCYEICNENDKSFYDPEDNSIITSCYELLGKYIKDT